MVFSSAATLGSLAVLFQSLWAQQLKDGLPAFMSYPGISRTCESALNTTVDCPAFLHRVSVRNSLLNTDQVQSLCSGSCTSDLQSARAKIAAACTANTDVIVDNNIAYPATFIVDRYLYTSNVSCYKDRSTGEYCDPQLLAWSKTVIWTTNMSCSDCWLGVQALQLGDPLGYDYEMASDFAALKASCTVSGYTYASPTVYALNATETDSVAPKFTNPPSCTGSYILKVGENCHSVAKNLSVSSYSMLNANGLDIHCQMFEAVANRNLSLCSPPTCTTHTWDRFDTCNDVASQYNISLAHFLAWNPNFNSICRNSIIWAGFQVCVSLPGGAKEPWASTNSTPSTGTSSAIPASTNSFPGSRKCGRWYTVKPGDNCGKLSVAFGITLSDFFFLDPEVYSNCTNLLLDVAYCVSPVGDIATYSSYSAPPTLSISVPPATFPDVSNAIPSATNHPNPDFEPHSLPIAPGTIQDCLSYANYDDYSGIVGVNLCSRVTSAFWIDFTNLIEWNPSLSKDETDCASQPGYSYCVQRIKRSPVVNKNCIPVEPSQIMRGTHSRCNCYTIVWGFDADVVDCQSVADDSQIKLSKLIRYNSWLKSDCDKALFADIGETEHRAVCIGINSTAPKSSGTTTTSTSRPATVTQPGIATDCIKF